MNKLAIFASGNGSNAANIAKYLIGNSEIEVSLILSNKISAFVLERAANLHIPSLVFDRSTFYNSEEVLKELRDQDIDYIVLAGFMWLIPDYLLKAFADKIINIHPALLPKYGGKGMYGDFVHQAVHKAKDAETGITIHLVNEVYDDGEILFQARVAVTAGDTPDDIATKVHELEYEHYPRVIEEFILR